MLSISLIIATVNRTTELSNLLRSLMEQTISRDAFEIIIVDQNKDGLIYPIVDLYNEALNIQYIQLSQRSVSKARNIGIDLAKGGILAFPDDDCKYYPDTLNKVIDFFTSHPDADMLLGYMYDRENKCNITRNKEYGIRKLSKWSTRSKMISSAIFTSVNEIKFDEKIGLGTHFESSEDLDYIYQFLKKDKNIYYSSDIHIWHPISKIENYSLKEIKSYALGHGAYVRKNNSIDLYFHFIRSIGYDLLLSFVFLTRGKKKICHMHITNTIYKIYGYIRWKG